MFFFSFLNMAACISTSNRWNDTAALKFYNPEYERTDAVFFPG